jgi:DNA-binding NarL/FixJ family response regulator
MAVPDDVCPTCHRRWPNVPEPEVTREIRLRYQDGVAIKKIAHELGMSESGVASQLRKLRLQGKLGYRNRGPWTRGKV